MKQDMENIKEQLEEVIKKKSKELSILLLGNIQYNDSRDNKEWRNAIIESSTEIISKELSIIADEVLKVVGKFLFENLQSNHDKCPNKMTCIGYQSCVSDIENLLSNLSTNKENKNNENSNSI